MESEIANLVLFIQDNIRGEIKDMHYITLLNKVQKIYLKSKEMKEVDSETDSDDECVDFDFGGQYC